MTTTNNGNRSKPAYKGYRLLWAYAYSITHGGKIDSRTYADKFGLAITHASEEIAEFRLDKTGIVALIDDDLPIIAAALEKAAAPDMIKEVPKVALPTATTSFVSINYVVDHRNKTVTYMPFKQTLYDEKGREVADVDFPEGQFKLDPV